MAQDLEPEAFPLTDAVRLARRAFVLLLALVTAVIWARWPASPPLPRYELDVRAVEAQP